MHEAHCEHNVLPLFDGFYALEEVWVDFRIERAGKAGNNTFRRHEGIFNGHLQQTEREVDVGLASYPEAEVGVDFLVSGVENCFHLSHKLQTELAITEQQPSSGHVTLLDLFLSWNLLCFSHGNLVHGRLFSPNSEIVHSLGGIRSCLKQVENGSVGQTLIIEVLDLIVGRLDIRSAQNSLNEVSRGKNGSVLANSSDQADVDEVRNRTASDSLIEVGHYRIFWLH